jgi:hypothetical protein
MLTGVRISLLLASAFVVAMLEACSPNVAIEFFNNSGVPLIVTGCKEPISVAPGEVGKVKSIYQCSNQVHFDGGAASWNYQILLPSHNMAETGQSYYRSHKWGLFNTTLIVRLQVNADRKVFALPEGSESPSSSNIPQPVGFPWKPVP